MSGLSASSSALSTSSESGSASLTPADDIIARAEPGSSADTLASDDDSSSQLGDRIATTPTHSDTSGTDGDTEDDAPTRHHRRRGSRHRRGDSQHRSKPNQERRADHNSSQQHLRHHQPSALSLSAQQAREESLAAILARLADQKAANDASAIERAERISGPKRLPAADHISESESSSNSDSDKSSKKRHSHKKHGKHLFEIAALKFENGKKLNADELSALAQDPGFRDIANAAIKKTKINGPLIAAAMFKLGQGIEAPTAEEMAAIAQIEEGQKALASVFTPRDDSSTVNTGAKTGTEAGMAGIMLIIGESLQESINSDKNIYITFAIWGSLFLIFSAIAFAKYRYLESKKEEKPTVGQLVSKNMAETAARDQALPEAKTKTAIMGFLQTVLPQVTGATGPETA